MAMLTERVPIIGPFTPSHAIAGRMDVGNVPFGEVFDMEYLSKAIGTPVLEWHEVKNSSSTEVEDIGCWSVWQAVQTRESEPRNGNALSLQGLGVYAPICVFQVIDLAAPARYILYRRSHINPDHPRVRTRSPCALLDGRVATLFARQRGSHEKRTSAIEGPWRCIATR